MKTKVILFLYFIVGMNLNAQWSVDVQAGYRYAQEKFDGKFSSGIHDEYYIDTFNIDFQPKSNGVGLGCHVWYKKRGFFPVSVSFNQWKENFSGTVWKDYLFSYDFAKSEYVINYQGTSEYLTLSVGAGYNVFPPEWPVELVGMVRLNPEILLSRKTKSINILASEWDEGFITYTSESYNYNYKNIIQFDQYNKFMVIGEVHPSTSLLISGASKFGMSFSAECGAKLQNFSRVTVMEAVQKPFGFYVQVNLGYRFQLKKKLPPEELPEIPDETIHMD